MLARGGSLVTCVVNRNGQDVVVSIRNTSTLQRARCWRAVTVKLNSTASVVILRLGDDFERLLATSGVMEHLNDHLQVLFNEPRWRNPWWGRASMTQARLD